MSDPGLHSKFIEMQQDERFNERILQEKAISDSERGLRLDIARIKAEMNNPDLNFQRRESLFRALKELTWKLRGV